ncbi:hypothetical protein AB1Y20_006597 [Prymnesium parvum]|uniref:DNA 3'-5' helicase n=1 Tax=Prymnesium parvum TaxID=97485 RepID=A0AB34J176_PRYPA
MPLDAHQSVCVLADPTQNMVVHACPGAGKSTTIARRCQALVERGVPPSRILVLTFSKASAIDLDTKMSQLGGMMPRATTYHAFALKVLRKLPGPHSSSSIIQPGQQRKLLRKLLPQGDPSQSKQLLKRAISVVSKTKASDATLAKADPQVAELLRRYDEELRRGNLIDFEDMITLTTRAIQEEEARSGQPFSPFHSHLLLDEAQDTSTGQLALLKAIAPVGGITLTAVGDADQTIYGFRGSRPDMLACIASYWGCTAFLLPNNYRCAPPIVYASRMIVDGASAHVNLPQEGVDASGVVRPSARGEGVRLDSFGSGYMGAVGVRMVRCAQRADELEGLARELLQRSSTRGTAAVLCRLRAECTQVRTVLKEFGVPLIAAEERSAWNKGQEGLGLLSFLRLATTPSDDAAFTVAIGIHSHASATFGRKGAAMAYLRGLQEPGGLLKAARAAKLRGFPQCKAQSNLTRPAQSALTQFLETMDDVCKCVQSPDPTRVDGLLASLAERVRFAVHLTKQDARGASSRRAFSVSTRESPPQQGHSSLDDSDDDESEGDVGTARVNKLLKLASRVAASLDPAASNIEQVAQFCDAMALASHDSASSPAKEDDAHAVVVSTIHQAKGLEWDVVYIPGLTDGVIPLVPRGLLPNSLELVEHYEEERRLMYVAITRARRSLVLSWPERDELATPVEGAAAQQKQRASALKPSRFLSQLLSACEAGEAPQIPPPAARTLWHDYPQPMETVHPALPRHGPRAAGTCTSFPAPQTRWQDYTHESVRPGLSGAWTGTEGSSAVCPRGSKRPMPPM